MNKSTTLRGTGRRKSAVARSMFTAGKGLVTINGRETELPANAAAPLVLVGKREAFDISIKVAGGGTTGQEGAIRHSIANALVDYDAELRPTLRKAGYLTRDDRAKERKKYGLKKARRAPQWSKR